MRLRMSVVVSAAVLVLAIQGALFADQLDYALKWSQPYDPSYSYTQDIPSYIVIQEGGEPGPGNLGHIALDDWLCTSPLPVTDIHWWGSYIGFEGAAAPVPPNSPDAFVFAIFEDVPVSAENPDFSHPGNEPIWDWQTTTYDEVYIGQEPFTNEAAFQYFVDIPEEDWFLQEPGEHVYWLAIAAIFEVPVGQDFGGIPGGWATRPHYFMDDAVVGQFIEIQIPGDGTEWVWVWEPLVDPAGNSMDLAFELSTVPEPSTLLVLASGIVALAGVVRKRLV